MRITGNMEESIPYDIIKLTVYKIFFVLMS